MPRTPKLNLTQLPYQDTQVPASTTKADIDRILRNAGADGIQWSDVFKPRRMAELKFARNQKMFKLTVPIHTDDIESQRRLIAPVKFDEYIRRREDAMYRAMLHYLTGLIKAEAHGLMTFEEAFIGHTEIRLPDGRTKTVREAVNEISNLIALPESKEG